MQHFLSRWKIALETLGIVAVLVVIKAIVQYYGIEMVGLNPLFTSIIGGGIFLFGLILAGTLADYKESEKVPAEIVAACESIWEEGQYVKKTRPEFDLDRLNAALSGIVESFGTCISENCSSGFRPYLAQLADSFLEMETLGVPPNYITRLKSETSIIRRNLLRVEHIQRTNFLPSAFVLVQSVVGIVLFLLVLTKIEPFFDAVVVLVIVTYLFVYILKLLHRLDTPFRPTEKTKDDVSLFLLRDFARRLGSS